MLKTQVPDRTIDPPEIPIDRDEWEASFVSQWERFQREADIWDITLGFADEIAHCSWEQDGFEQEAEQAAQDELITRFDCVYTDPELSRLQVENKYLRREVLRLHRIIEEKE